MHFSVGIVLKTYFLTISFIDISTNSVVSFNNESKFLIDNINLSNFFRPFCPIECRIFETMRILISEKILTYFNVFVATVAIFSKSFLFFYSWNSHPNTIRGKILSGQILRLIYSSLLPIYLATLIKNHETTSRVFFKNVAR